MEVQKDPILIFLTALMGAILALCWVLYLSVKKEGNEWATFKKDHACRIVAKIEGGASIAMVGDKVGVTVQDDLTGWLCDDGITYYK